MKLRTQFLLSNVGLVLGTAVFISLAVFFLVRHTAVRWLEEERSRRATTFAEACRQSSLQKNDILLAGHMRVIARDRDLAYAYFVDDNGRLRVHTDPRFVRKPLADWTADRRPPDAEERSIPIVDSGRLLGTAVMGFDRSQGRALINTTLRRLAGGIALAAFLGILIGSFAALILAARTARPLREMARAAEQIGQGRFNIVMEVRAAQEVEALARALNDMETQLGRLEEMRDEFVQVVSHDLLSPLTAMITAGDYLKETAGAKLDDNQKECLSAITEKADQIAHFARTLLDLAKMKAGKMSYLWKEFDAGKLLARLAHFYRHFALKQGVEIVWSAEEGMTILADEEKIERVLTNLLSNGLKFAPRGTGRIALSAFSDSDGVTFLVADNGTGIPAEDQSYLFRKFSRLDPADQAGKKITGTGIGLSIAKTLVEGHGGRIWVESSSGQGTRFLFHLPRLPPAAPPPAIEKT